MRIALNPIQWMASDDGWLDPSKAPDREKLLTLVKEAGFEGVMAEVPAGWSVDRYREVVADTGLALAPGYFVYRYDDAEADTLDRAATVARQHAELGLTDVGLGMGMSKEAPRVLHPAQGHEPSTDRLSDITARIGRIAEVMQAEGVRPALHPHVGTWIETDAESRTVLDALPSIGFLPDTGHLAWAGIDVRALIADYATRTPFVHVKDCRLSIAQQGKTQDWHYRQTVLAGLWAEPGRGELPLPNILAALPEPFNGWLMVEVDRPDITDPFESAKTSATWMHKTFN
jgi:inosose dehydratase